MFLDSIFTNYTVLFLGCSLEDELRTFLETLNVRTGSLLRSHYALTKMRTLSERDRNDFHKTFKIALLGDDDHTGYPDIHNFVVQLRSRTPRPPGRTTVSVLSKRRPTAFFVGRKEYLKQLHDSCTRSPAGTIIVVSGLGGTGKTALAHQYARMYEEEYRAVLWVASDSSENINAGFADLADALVLSKIISNLRLSSSRRSKRGLTATLTGC
jgi:signal recognition particle GTPase